ncbi:hypothetical protein FOZ60_003190 [Perkinsus olseni]|uniref:Uncharacterized protein n=1 Tax=Perkinsus olseni TaxID=32597 RepID=A0A7J6NW95_PEROL|nr:hypothetical protein FOZ60_003190 [Perkinsus olseni]
MHSASEHHCCSQAKSLAQTAEEAFGASECRAKNDAGQTLYWRLWYRENFYSYYQGDPLSLLKRPEAELTVAFLVDGREYGVDLNKEWEGRLTSLLRLEKMDEDVRADYNGTCKIILDAGQISLRKEFLPPSRRRVGSDDYTLKQLRSDIALYERAIKAGKEDATFKFKDLEDIASEASTKESTLGRNRWWFGRTKREKSARKRPRHDFVSFVYRVDKENDKYVDKYFTVSVGWEPETCEQALEMGLERLFESHKITNLKAFSRFTPIDVEARLKKVRPTSFCCAVAETSETNKKFSPVASLGEGAVTLGEPLSEIARRSLLFGVCFGFDDTAKLSWRLEDPKYFMGPLFNEKENKTDTVIVMTIEDSKEIPAFGVYAWEQYLYDDNQLSCSLMMETFVALAYKSSDYQSGSVSVLGLKGDLQKAMSDYVLATIQEGGVPSLSKAMRSLEHETLQLLGANADEAQARAESEVSVLLPVFLRSGEARILSWMPTVGKGAKEQREGTNVEIRLGDGRKLVLLISRDDFPEVQKCSTALRAAGSRLYVDFTMQMTKSELVFDISRWSRGKAGTFEHTDYLRQKVYHPERDPRLYSTNSKGLPYNKFFRPSRLSDPFTNDEVLEVSPVHTAVLPSSRGGDLPVQLTPALSFLPMRALIAGLVISATYLVTARSGCFGGRCSDDSFRWEQRGGQGDPVPSGTAVKNAGGHRAARGQATRETKTASFFPDTKAKSLKLAARAAFIVFECRARGEGDQTLFWRLWRRDDFSHFYGWKPNILFERPDSDLTVTFLVDGIEYGVDLPRERSRYIETLLEGDEETASDNPHICLTIMNDSRISLKADGSGLVEEGAGGADYTLKQLRNDITLDDDDHDRVHVRLSVSMLWCLQYQRALSRGDKDARFEFRTLQWIGAHAVMKKNTQKELSCFSEDVKFRWKAYRRKYTGPRSLVALRAATEEEPTGRKASASLKGFFVSLVYNFTRKNNEYEDRYFTVRVPAHPRSCEHALELGLEHLYERTEPGKPMWDIALNSNLSQSCFGYDDSTRLSWRLEDIRVFPGPFVNKQQDDSDAALVVDFHDSKDIPPFAVYTKAGELHVNGSISCLDAMETFVQAAYRSKYRADDISILGFKGDLEKATRDFVMKAIAENGITVLRNESYGLVVSRLCYSAVVDDGAWQHESLQVVGQDADLVKEQQPSQVSSSKAQRQMVCKSDDSDFMWTVEEPKLKNKKRVKTKSTSVEIGIGSDRKLPLLVSRSEYPDLTSCYTALEAANEQLYQQFDMRAITRSELVSDISRYLTAIKEVAKLQREERPKIKLSAKSLLLAANEAFVVSQLWLANAELEAREIRPSSGVFGVEMTSSHFYGWKPNILFERPDSDLTVTFLVDGM